jgi:hypothetical protein
VQLAAEHRIQALRPDPAGNWQQIVVKVTSSAGQRDAGLEADCQFDSKMATADRDGCINQRLDLIQVGA